MAVFVSETLFRSLSPENLLLVVAVLFIFLFFQRKLRRNQATLDYESSRVENIGFVACVFHAFAARLDGVGTVHRIL